jgi:hypothetical protein
MVLRRLPASIPSSSIASEKKMKRRDLILGSTGLLLPVFARSAVPTVQCTPPPPTPPPPTPPPSPPPSQLTYTTNFPLTENPISEGGRWINGGIFGKTNVQTSPGKAFGTMVGFDGTNFIDSCACLKGFGPDQQITCTIANSGNFSGYSLELELLLRAEIAADHIHLYEVDCVYGGSGIDLARWDMTKANPNSYTLLRARQQGEVPFSNGDQVQASIIGTLITVKYKRVGGAFATLFTHDTAGDSLRYSSGNPGIAAWNQTGSASAEPLFAWSSFAASSS